MSNCNFRLMAYNFIDVDYIAASYYTSQQTAFPVTNIYNKNRRSKVWRSAGYFNITTSNNGIVFKKTSGGTDITASIAVAEYTSIASLITAIKAALDTADGVNTYTVTQSNFRFNIASSGSYLDLRTTQAGFTSADLLGFDTAADRTGALTYIADEARIHQYERLTWDLGVVTNPDMFALICDRNRPLKLSPGSVIKIEGNETNNWTVPTYSKTLTYDDEVMSEIAAISGLNPSGALRFWSLYIQDRTNPNGYIEIGSLFLGNYFNPSRGRVQFPLETTLIDNTETVYSEGGQSYSDIKEQSAEYTASWYALEKEDIEEFQSIFASYGTGLPFFVSMDSGAVFSSNINKRIIFCKFSSVPKWQLESPNNFSMDMELREEL